MLLFSLLLAHSLGTEVEASLFPMTASIQPGKPFTVAVHLQPDDGWHTYWVNPGDSGQATRIDWKLPKGFTAGPLRWPKPERMGQIGDIAYGYDGPVYLPVEITPPSDLAPGTKVKLSGKVSWLACKGQCIPGSQDVSLELPVKSSDPIPDRNFGTQIAEVLRDLPRSFPKGGGTVVRSANGKTLVLRIPIKSPLPEEIGAADIFPSEFGILEHVAKTDVTISKDAVVFRLLVSQFAAKPAKRLKALLMLTTHEAEKPKQHLFDLDLPVGD